MNNVAQTQPVPPQLGVQSSTSATNTSLAQATTTETSQSNRQEFYKSDDAQIVELSKIVLKMSISDDIESIASDNLLKLKKISHLFYETSQRNPKKFETLIEAAIGKIAARTGKTEPREKSAAELFLRFLATKMEELCCSIIQSREKIIEICDKETVTSIIKYGPSFSQGVSSKKSDPTQSSDDGIEKLTKIIFNHRKEKVRNEYLEYVTHAIFIYAQWKSREEQTSETVKILTYEQWKHTNKQVSEAVIRKFLELHAPKPVSNCVIM